VPQFGDLVRRYGRWLQDHLEATGIPPDLQFAPAVGQLTAPANVFRRRGQMWTLVYNGTTVYMRDAKGLRYIAMLLARPNREIWSLEMVTAAEAGSPAHPRAQPYRSGTAEQLEAKGLSVADSYWRDSPLDAEAIAAYRRQYEELEEDLRAAQDNNDPERAAQCRTDMAALAEALTKDTGLGGKPRPHGPAELARKSVHAAIARGLDRSEKEHPQLGRHLRSSIETGLVCTYEPETPVTWDL
jgi:hypothetical protein